MFSYDGVGEILSRTDGTISGSTFTALSGSTTANPDAQAPQHLAYVGTSNIATLGEDGQILLSDGLVQPVLGQRASKQRQSVLEVERLREWLA